MPHEDEPIEITGSSIRVKLPNGFRRVNPHEAVPPKGDKSGEKTTTYKEEKKSIIYEEEDPNARIRRVEITSKKKCGTFIFKPVNGILQIKIFYDHHKELTLTSEAEED